MFFVSLDLNVMAFFTWVIIGAHNMSDPTEPTQVRVQVPTTEYRIHPGWNATLMKDE
jgi:hypothetical protein